MSKFSHNSQINYDKRSYYPNLNINFNQNNNRAKINTLIYNENIEIEGSNIYSLNNKGKLGLSKKQNNKIPNINYLNHKTQIYNKKYNKGQNEQSNPSSSLINENKKKNKYIDYFENYDLKKIKNI